MTNEEKQLLLKDICARLPYGVKVQVCNLKEHTPTVKGLLNDELYVQFDYITKPIKNGDSTYNIINDNIKPYLRPMSLMTEEEARKIAVLSGILTSSENILSISVKEEFIDIKIDDGVCSTETRTLWFTEMPTSITLFDYLNAHHFDYRGLIPMWLALPAKEGMYND